MFFVSELELDKELRKLRTLHGDSAISDDLRGWNWANDFLSPPLENVYFSVSELANRYCPTYRDIYLRRIARVSAPITFKTIRGRVYHRISTEAVKEAKSTLYSKGLISGVDLLNAMLDAEEKVINSIFDRYGISKHLTSKQARGLFKEAKLLYRFMALQASARLDEVISKSIRLNIESIVDKFIPVDVEKPVDGRLIGLSQELRIDMLTNRRIIMEIKTGDVRSFHKYSLAGYALALEADAEIPIDYGVVSYISVRGKHVKTRSKTYFLGDELRREFLEIRDEAFNLIHNGKDPGKPPRCPESCIYYDVCGGGRA